MLLRPTAKAGIPLSSSRLLVIDPVQEMFILITEIAIILILYAISLGRVNDSIY